MWPVLVFLYYRLSVQEERALAAKFGEEFRIYAERTPRLLPLRLRKEASGR
jgi:protein-S-isoprenylcysteine O-methyltransferase Ste14